MKGLYTKNPLVDYGKKYDLTSPVKDAIAAAEFVQSTARDIELRFREMRVREEELREKKLREKEEKTKAKAKAKAKEEVEEEVKMEEEAESDVSELDEPANSTLLRHPSAADLQELETDESRELSSQMKGLLLKTRKSEKDLKKASRKLLSPKNKSPKHESSSSSSSLSVKRNLFGNHTSSVRSLLSASRATG